MEPGDDLKKYAASLKAEMGAQEFGFATAGDVLYVQARFADIERVNIAKVHRLARPVDICLEIAALRLLKWHQQKLEEWGGPKPGGENDPPVRAGATAELAWKMV